MGKKKVGDKGAGVPAGSADLPASGATPAARAPAPAPRKAQPGGGCPTWVNWILFPTLVLGMVPVCLMFLPSLIPPTDGIKSGTVTMTGGAGAIGVQGLFSVLGAFGTEFCGEHGARDTVKCHYTAARLAYHMMAASEMVDFYTTLPQVALRDTKFKDATSPMPVGKQWVEAVVDPLGINPSQVARLVLESQGRSRERLPPLAAASLSGTPLPSFEERVAKVACYSQFDKVFGKARTAPLAEGVSPAEAAKALWGESGRRIVYVFGMDAALAVAQSLPTQLENDTPINIVILPLLDYGHNWLARTRGRIPCDESMFAQSYDSAFHFFSWITRDRPSSQRPGASP